jgi:hypothetical protein
MFRKSSFNFVPTDNWKSSIQITIIPTTRKILLPLLHQYMLILPFLLGTNLPKHFRQFPISLRVDAFRLQLKIRRFHITQRRLCEHFCVKRLYGDHGRYARELSLVEVSVGGFLGGGAEVEG